MTTDYTRLLMIRLLHDGDSYTKPSMNFANRNIFWYILRSLIFADSHTKFGTNFVVHKLSNVREGATWCNGDSVEIRENHSNECNFK